MNKKYVGLFTTAGLACLPVMASAAGPSLSDVLVNSGITANGYVSASYDATLNQTNGATAAQVPFHAFDTNSNSFYLNQAALTLSYLPTSGFGALVNIIAGEDAKVINTAYQGGVTSGNDFAVTQGYVQYATGNLTVIGGRFVTLAGEEVIDDTKNANISRSLLFTNLEPLVHTGVRATYKFSDLLTVNGGFSNSALGGDSQDNNKFKTIEANATITPNSATTISLTDYYGVEDSSSGASTPKTKVNYFDVVGSWQATPALLLAANGDYVRSIGSLDTVPSSFFPPVPGSNAVAGNDTGAGLALYATYAFNDNWKGSLRGEYAYFKGAADGTPSGIGHLAEGTATVDYSATKSFDVLGEIREDYGSVTSAGLDSGVYPHTPGFQKSQTEFLVKAIYKFGTPAPTT